MKFLSTNRILQAGIKIEWLLLLLGGMCLKKILWHIMKQIVLNKNRKQFKKIAQEYHISQMQQNDDDLQQICIDHLDSNLIQIVLNQSVEGLKQMLQQGTVTSEDLVNIFTFRALKLNTQLEMITFTNYKEAIKLARQCDQKRAQKIKIGHDIVVGDNYSQLEQGELFGIPISIKDTILQKGFASTIGCTSKIGEIQEKDGLLVTILKLAGAIPFIRSNIPQCAMTNESVNFLFGRVKNPWNQLRSAGGSSGGEGALIASRSSPLGIGSDVAGSIRMPTSFCGICGFKPTAHRVTMKGHSTLDPTFAGFQAFKCSVGPMGKYVEDLVIQMKVLCNNNYYQHLPIKERDLYQLVKEFDNGLYNSCSGKEKKFRIGYFKDLDIFPLCATSNRAMEEAKNALQNRGHELVEIKMEFANKLVEIFFKLFGSDKGALFDNMLKGEEMIEEYGKLKQALDFSKQGRKQAAALLDRIGWQRSAFVLRSFKPCFAMEYRMLVAELNMYQERFFQMWDQSGIDAILSPAFPIPALPHGLTKELGLAATYLLIWNLLNMPVGCIPITVVREDEQNYDNIQINDNITNQTRIVMQNSKGMPIGVQICTLPLEEEKCLGILKQLEQEIQFYKIHPLPDNF